jgi:HEAT repeat protein
VSDALVLDRDIASPQRHSAGRSILASVRLRRRRKPDVAELRSRGDLSGLRAVSRHRDLLWDRDGRPVDLGAPVRARAVEALSDFYGPEVVEALYEAIGDRDASVRRIAVTGLLELDSPAAATALIAALVDWPEGHDSELKAKAAGGLAAMDASGLPEAYAARLLESDRAAATPFDVQLLEDLLGADARGGAARLTLVDFLISRLEAPHGEVDALVESLLESLAADSVEPLLRCLDGGPGRIGAARLLGASRDVRAVEPLVRLLGDPDPEARATAALSLGRLKHAGSVEALLHATRDDEYHVRDAAMSALDSMGAAAVTVGLASMVEPARLGAGPKATSGSAELVAGPTEPTDGAGARDRRQPIPWAERMLDRLLGPGSGGP